MTMEVGVENLEMPGFTLDPDGEGRFTSRVRLSLAPVNEHETLGQLNVTQYDVFAHFQNGLMGARQHRFIINRY